MNLDEAVRRLEKLPPEIRAKLTAEVMARTKSLKMIPNPGPQTDAFLCVADDLLYGGSAGAGKGFRKDQPVLTPFGWQAIGNLKVGSMICATDGTAQKIIAKYERGKQPLFKLTWSDGTETICDSDHIWLAWKSGKTRKIGNARSHGEGSARKWTTQEIYNFYQRDSLRNRIAIPVMSEPCCFNVAGQQRGRHKFIKRSIHPYILGVLLGDGNLSGSSISYTKPDVEIKKKIEEILGVELSSTHSDGRCPTHRIPASFVKGHLEDLDLLGCLSNSKFIPRIYLLATVEERWHLAQGLMDTDGWCEEDGESYYGTVSKKLADDAAHLFRSLGAIVTIREKDPTYTYKGEKLNGQHFYTLRIKIKDSSRLFSLPRKVSRCVDKEFQNMGIYLDDIQPAGEGETVCIVVSHPNSLFVTEGFIVTHNTSLLVGSALTIFRRSLILRRKYSDMSAIAEECVSMNGSRNGFTQMPRPKLRADDGRLIEFEACQHLGDEESFQGQAHDLKGFDEITQFLEKQFRYIKAWCRPGPGVPPEQKCQTIAASNPPTSSSGDWVIGYWRPWLDPTFHNPAKPGELRWVITDEDGNDEWVDGPEPIMVNGKMVKPKSRTFIPGKLADNPYLVNSGYAATLDALPEPLRSALRDGNFMLSRSDNPRQLIPTAWVRAAQERWKTTQRPSGIPMSCVAGDPAAGGPDKRSVASRYDYWFDKLDVTPGKDTPNGSDVAAKIIKVRKDSCQTVVDLGGGYGSAVKMCLEDNGIEVTGYKGAVASIKRDKSGQLGFFNVRSEVLWTFREALDPDQPGGSDICLPPDPVILTQLTAVEVDFVRHNKILSIKAEPKEDVKERLGSSPDEAESIVMCWWKGPKGIAPRHPAKSSPTGKRTRIVKANLGHSKRKGQRR